ncbi:MAG: dipeptide epimerase [Sediminibacterium sp.]|nr:dipeptide epimerase [Sediminibacterium sp.]
MLHIELFHQITPFKFPFTISGGRTKSHQESLLVKISNGYVSGWGESPAIAYYNVSVPNMIEKINAKLEPIRKFTITDPLRFGHFLYHLFPQDPFIVNALDMAGWDYFGQISQKKLYEIFNTDWLHIPEVMVTIGISSLAEMKLKMAEYKVGRYKFKLGFPNDIEFIKQHPELFKGRWVADCNGGWSPEDCLHKLTAMAEFKPDFIEQPLAIKDHDLLKKIKNNCNINLFSDESFQNKNDLLFCSEAYHGINIKLTKCGGISAALSIIKEAKKLGLKIMMGSMNETLIGSLAIIHFLPQLDYVDADGLLLLKDQPLSEIYEFYNDHISFKNPSGYGLGLPHNFNVEV